MPRPPDVLGVAVSGGSDSVALLHLLHMLATLHGTRLRAVTVNHGLRPEAAEEAQSVAVHCARLSIPHETLIWKNWDGQGNLQNAARHARYEKIAGWAERHNINTVALGHTADDQAETVLMRLARRSGVDGLSAMRRRTQRCGITWVRPMLDITRDRLRVYLTHENISWIEDPSNQNMHFDRIKAREALIALSPLGIDVHGLSEVASHMSQCQQALDWQTFLAAKDIVTFDAGAVILDEPALRLLPEEIQRRLFLNAMRWISGSVYPPRRKSVADLITALRTGQARTVDGCHARRIGTRIWIFRELNAVAGHLSDFKDLWDGRWRLYPPDGQNDCDGLKVGALTEKGLDQCPDWRECGRPRTVLLSTPAVWQENTVIAAPLAGFGQNWQATVEGGEDTFFAALLTH